MLPTNSSYYPPQGHPCYYPSAVQSAAQHPAYFNPYHNFGLTTQHLSQPLQPLQQQIPVPTSAAANDSGIHSQPPSPDEDDKENAGIQSNAPGKSKDSSLNDEERKKYREKRDRNNHAAKQSRMHRKQREMKLSTELVHSHEINKHLQDELAIYRDQYSRILGSIQQAVHQLKARGADPSDVLAQLQECSNSMMASMSQQNQALMAPPHPQGFPTFF